MSLRNKIAAAFLCIVTAAIAAVYFVSTMRPKAGAVGQVYNGVLDLEPNSRLEPGKIFDVHGIRLSKQIYSSLVAYDHQYAIVGDLSSGWHISADGKEYIFSLRPGLRFHDGVPVTASAIADCLRLLGEHGSIGKDVWKYVSFIGTKGDRIIVIRLHQKFSPFLDFLASQAAGISKAIPQPSPYRPIGTGPYRVKKWVPGNRITLERNPYYHGPTPNISEVNFYLPKGPGDIRELLKTVRLHDLGWYNPDIGEYRGDYIELEAPSLQVSGVFFNLSKPPFSDPVLRNEFVRALDKKALIQQIYPGGIIANGYLPFGLLGHNNDLPANLYDPSGSFSRLRAYKKPIRIRSGIRDKEELRRLDEFLQKTFRRYSLDVRLKNTSEKEIYDAFVAGDYEAIKMSNEAAFSDAFAMLSCFHKDYPGSLTRYTDREYDLLLEQSLLTDDRNARAKIYERMDAFLVQHYYLLPLYYNSKKKKFHKSVRGIHMSLLGEHLIDISRLSLE